ncbi:MAG: hypothetical protein E7617_00415 [Ruminococcaceae bacterium]|nr:hypothetical protein [Oscillospiraceae bacterium]
MKKTLLITVSAILLVLSFASVASASFLGTGAAVIANDVELIKSGISGKELKFSDTDFKCALGVSEIKGIEICTLPDKKDGILKLDGSPVNEGQIIKRRALSRLSFCPADASITESQFTFRERGSSGAEIRCRMRFTEKVNYAPEVSDSLGQSVKVTTQSGISYFGKLEGSDPEGDKLITLIVRQPKNGSLSLTDAAKGEYRYTPDAGFDGRDSFILVMRDEFGNYSSPEEISVRVTERMSEVVYSDMTDSKSYNAAVAMTAMGIMSGSRIGDNVYFLPEDGVTRAEFVAMAMKAASIKADSTLDKTYFDDNNEIPTPLVGYVATAASIGIVNGSFDGDGLKFRPNDAITVCEAAIVMSNILGVTAESDYPPGTENLPVWARPHVGAMYEKGIFDLGEEDELSEALTREKAAEYLYRLASGQRS